MKLDVVVTLNLKTKEATATVLKAARLAMRDTAVNIWSDGVHTSPIKTGHNRRSLTADVSGIGTVRQGKDSLPEKVVDDDKIQGAIYSTSGYGGFLETGTVKMAARPYLKPAADKEISHFPEHMKKHLGVT